MRMNQMKKKLRCVLAVLLAAGLIAGLAGCGGKEAEILEQAPVEEREELVFFSPTAKGNEKVEGGALHAIQFGIDTFEQAHQDIYLSYKSYTAKGAQEKSYDDVVKDRVRSHMGDDLYVMNPDVAYELNGEGYLYDLSGLDSAQKLTDAARSQCTVGGKLISIPMSMICYCLFVNEDLLEQCSLELPNTKQEFLHCCEVLKANGITPIAANRWWMETFVLTQGFVSLYQEEGRAEKIAALNSGETPISQYMRPGFEFLAELMEKGYFDVDFAAGAEAGDEKDLFLNQEAAFVIHHDGAIQEQVYGNPSFNMAVIGFPTDEYGQVSLMNASHRICINSETEHLESAIRFAEVMTSKEVVADMLENNGGFSPRTDVVSDRPAMLERVYENVDAGRVIPGSNPEIRLEQWGTTCVMIQELFAGKSVDEVMDDFDALQQAQIAQTP